MFRISILALSFSIAAAFAATADEDEAVAEALTFEANIIPIVDAYCVDCHNQDSYKGDLDLLRFETTDMVLDSFAIWERAGKRLENKEMPPRDRDQPTDTERETFVAWIKALEFDDGNCDRLASEETVSWYPGYVMSRRLNRAEYENTIRDLFGTAVPVAHLFPADGAGGEGFDNNGNALFLSAIQIEKYLEAADLVVETVVGSAGSGFTLPRDALVAAALGVYPNLRDAARSVIAAFLPRAWRRPVTPGEVDHLLALYDTARDRGDGYLDAIKLPLKAAIVSPNFLFLAEPEPGVKGVYPLGHYPLAARLSYFLWASMPDEELFALAEQGRLQDDAALRGQVERMLRDPKARALGEVFATQWLGIVELGEITRPDPERFPEFDDTLAASMREELVSTFHHIVANDRSLLELIDARYTFANERLAAIYEIPGVEGDELRSVLLGDANRGGVTGMPAVLTATSHPLRTSPVLRGKWVLERLLGERVPPPPPEVTELPPDDVQPDGLTLRERLEAHRSQAECASCHARMDPLGFGLENFDPIGRWRDRQGGQPVNAEGVLPSGETFTGPAELKQILLARKNQFTTNLARKMLGYALGRSLTRYDRCVIEDALAALEQDGYRASHLFTEIALSTPFRNRYSTSGAPAAGVSATN